MLKQESSKVAAMKALRRLVGGLIIVASGVLILCAIKARAAGNGTQHFEGVISATFADACTGENVDAVATVDTDIHAVADGGGGFHVDIHDVFSGRGAGETTGTKYIANQTDSFVLNAKVGLENTAELHFALISQGGSDNLEVHMLLHITVNANGVVTVAFDNVSASCR